MSHMKTTTTPSGPPPPPPRENKGLWDFVSFGLGNESWNTAYPEHPTTTSYPTFETVGLEIMTVVDWGTIVGNPVSRPPPPPNWKYGTLRFCQFWTQEQNLEYYPPPLPPTQKWPIAETTLYTEWLPPRLICVLIRGGKPENKLMTMTREMFEVGCSDWP